MHYFAFTKLICVNSNGADVINYDNFVKSIKSPNIPYLRKYVLVRIFTLFDTKKDNVLDFEEYISAICFFRINSTEDQIKMLYIMYDGGKSSGGLNRDNFRKLLVDATIISQREDIPLPQLESWIQVNYAYI